MEFFQPSFKLAGKERDGVRVGKKYHRPATPCQRLLADPRTSAEVRQKLEALQAALGPVSLLQEMRVAQRRLVEIADAPVKENNEATSAPTLGAFLSGLRAAWQDGDARPTAKPKVKAKRLRRRPDPLAAVVSEIRDWFDAEPWRTGRELPERLQQADPATCPDGLPRTLQRRLKAWRDEMARRMVFATSDGADAKEGNTSPLPTP